MHRRGTAHVLVLAVLAFVPSALGLYEDQIGKTDWSRTGLGPPNDNAIFIRSKKRNFPTSQVCFSSRENVLACLDAQTGRLTWRRVFEENDQLNVCKHSMDRTLTISGNGKTVRLFRSATGTMSWKGNTYLDNGDNESKFVQAEFVGIDFSNKGKRSSIAMIVGNSVQMWDGNDDARGQALWEWTPDSADIRPRAFTLSNTKVCIDANKECYESGELLHIVSTTAADSSTVIISVLVASSGEAVDQWSQKKFSVNEAATVNIIDERTAAIQGQEGQLLLLGLDKRMSETAIISSSSHSAAEDGKTLQDGPIFPGDSFTISLLDETVLKFQSTVSNIEMFYEVDHDELSLRKLSKLSTPVSSKKTLTHALSAILILDDADVCHLSAATTDGNTEIVVRMGRKEIGKKLVLPVGLRGQVVAASFDIFNSKRPNGSIELSYRALLTMADDSILMVRDGVVIWSLEEALTDIVQAEFITLPLTMASEKLNKAAARVTDVSALTLSERLASQVEDIQQIAESLVESITQGTADSSTLNNAFGLDKLAILVTRANKLFALHSNSGSIAWSLYVGSRFSECRLLPGDAKLIIKLLCVPHQNADSSVILSVSVTTGKEQSRSTLDYRVMKVLQSRSLAPSTYLLVDTKQKVHIYPETISAHKKVQGQEFYFHDADEENGRVSGYTARYNNNNKNFNLELLWAIQFPSDTERLIKCEGYTKNERSSAPALIRGDDSVLIKYLNRNLITCAIESVSSNPSVDSFVKIMVIDTVSGRVIHQQKNWHATTPVHVTMFENWVVYSYFRDDVKRTELNSIVFYEDAIGRLDLAPWNPLDRDENFSSFNEQLFFVQRQSFVLNKGIRALDTTKTRYGITARHLLIATHDNQLMFLDPKLLDPRRPVGSPTAAEKTERLMQYHAHLPTPDGWMLSYNLTLQQIDQIVGVPVNLESTSMVFAFGLDLFSSRLTPSKPYDLLPEEFNKTLLVLILTGLTVASFVLQNLVRRKRLIAAWA